MGFTLIELLVVIAIIAVLSALAIQQFSEYRTKGFDAQALSDLRNVMTAEEAYFAAKNTYVAVTKTGPGQLAELPGVSLSEGVTLSIAGVTSTDYTATSTSDRGSGKVFRVTGSVGIIR